MDSDEEKICKVCQEVDNEKLIAPCNCSGSVKYIHEACLEKWIRTSKNGTTCPTCGSRYRDEFIVTIIDSASLQERLEECIDLFCKELGRAVMQFVLLFIVSLVMFDGEVTIQRGAMFVVPLFFIFKMFDIYKRYRIITD